MGGEVQKLNARSRSRVVAVSDGLVEATFKVNTLRNYPCPGQIFGVGIPQTRLRSTGGQPRVSEPKLSTCQLIVNHNPRSTLPLS